MILPLYAEYLKEFEYYIIEGWLFLKYIEIHKKYRRQGIGKRVMKDLMGYCEENNLNLFLFPANSNSKYLRCLIKFYSGCGMEQLINDEGFIVFVKYYGDQRPDLPVLPGF
jgi:GNAT superfamily N-acetyltransferase